ncbi:MAG: ABC transporter substrate-binding protein [Gammaproteobacteria bacterium]|nr:ABC transporter substrate-binding protein [Gammaproteobacteria bacterium]
MSQINIMALRHSAFYSPLLMTMAGGFLKDEGLEPSYVLSTPDNTVVDNINRGSCHLAQSAVATSFEALERGETVDIVHFAQINSRDGFFIAAREPDADFSWNKLVGKKVLVDHFFQPLAMLKYALYKQGVDFNSIEVVDAGDVDAIDRAFRNGEADYVHQQGPAPQQLEHDGIGYVVAAVGDAVGPVAFSSLCASRDWLKTDMAQAFMRAYKKSLDYVINAPAAEIARREFAYGFFPDIDLSVLRSTIEGYQQLGCWQSDPIISRSAYDNLIDVFLFNGRISQRHDYDEAIVSL